MVKSEVRKNAYYDSVTLMLISREIKKIDGVHEALIGMGTELNLSLVENLGLRTEEMKDVSPNDFFVTVKMEDTCDWKEIIEEVDNQLNKKEESVSSSYRPPSLSGAVKQMPDANLVVISIPGQYAKAEVDDALDKGLHVMLFSDNVPVEDEVALKKKAVEKELLMMGPDCGTAIINGKALAFANVVKRGDIGIVGASGTGTQEVSVLVDRYGEGLSQVIGTGGRDLKSEVGGLMMLQGFKALIEDDETKVIVLISKPPAPEVAEKILELVKTTTKPVVVDFIGGDAKVIEAAGAYPCISLEDAAKKAVALSRGESVSDFDGFDENLESIEKEVSEKVKALSSEQKNLRALFTGGTLADEAMKLLYGYPIYSNIPLEEKYAIENLSGVSGHICLDLGEDQFTQGRPHPMIDPMTRTEFFKTHVDDSVAVVLVDVVLGYGSHEDPAGEVAKSIAELNEKLSVKPVYVASITGTYGDPQDYEKSVKSLEDLGVKVLPSNAQASRYARLIMEAMGGK